MRASVGGKNRDDDETSLSSDFIKGQGEHAEDSPDETLKNSSISTLKLKLE